MPKAFLKNTEFKEIRDSLRDFLRDPDINPEFTDMDFEGSNINVIINLLSYVAHHHAIYSNLVLNEAFLRTAHTRASVVSRTKDLNYVPRSYTAATMLVDLTLTDIEDSPSSYTLTRGTKFKANVDGEDIPFVLTEDVTAPFEDGEYHFEDLRLRQGKMRSFRYVVDEENQRDLFEIPDEKADVSLLRVRVRENSESTRENTFRKDDNVVDQSRDSRVYYLQEGPNGKYQIEFGDDVISKQLEPGNIIKLDWVHTRGKEGNSISSIRPDFEISGGYDYSISVNQSSYGGDDKESIESIKFTAPKHWAQQNRVVTPEDYYVELKNNLGDIRDLKIWGGEDNDPPTYGKVFIALETEEQIITRGAARDIDERILRPKRMPTVIPEFVSPSYIHPNITLDVIYNAKMTAQSRSLILDKIRQETKIFLEDEGRKFDARVFLSELEYEIRNIIEDDEDGEEEAIREELGLGGTRGSPIRSVTADVSLTIEKSTSTNKNVNLKFNFGNEIEPETIESNRFTSIERFQDRDSRIVDNGKGGLFIFDVNSGERTSQRIGDVDYEKGEITITDLRIREFYQDYDSIFITVEPKDKRDLRAKREQIFKLGEYSRNVLAGIPAPLEVNLSIL